MNSVKMTVPFKQFLGLGDKVTKKDGVVLTVVNFQEVTDSNYQKAVLIAVNLRLTFLLMNTAMMTARLVETK